MSDEEDEEVEEEQEEDGAIGPKCAVCGKSTDSLYPVLVKREVRSGRFEMVQIYLCAFHYKNRLDTDAIPPPPEDNIEETIQDLWDELFGGPDGEDENDDDWS